MRSEYIHSLNLLSVSGNKGRVYGWAEICFQKRQEKRAWEGTGRGTAG